MKIRIINTLTTKTFCTQIYNTTSAGYQQKYRHVSTSTAPKPFEAIPGLSSLPILGPLHHFLPLIGSLANSNFYKLTETLYEKFGPIVKLDGVFARASFVFFFEPEYYEQVFRAEEALPSRPGFQTSQYYREELRKSTYNGVYGLTTAEGTNWRQFRRKVNPALLKPKLVKLYEPGLHDIATDFVNRLIQQKDDISLQNNLDLEITKWSLESIGLVGLGARLGCLKDDLPEDCHARSLMKCTIDIMDLTFKLEFRPSLWRYIPTSNYKNLMKTYDKQWEISQIFIEQAKVNIKERGHQIPEEDKSVIEKLLAIDEEVAIMMANEMLLAGIDTVSFATTAFLYCLATNPEVQEKLRREIRSNQSVNKRYLKACLKETLRLYPVITSNLRRTTKEHIVAGYRIPKGVDVVSPNEFLSKMEKHYPKALEYIPERWLAEKTDPLYYGNTHPMVNAPFGFGVRSCIGRRIAELEIETLVKVVLDKIKVSWEGPPINVTTHVMNKFIKPYYFKFEPVQ